VVGLEHLEENHPLRIQGGRSGHLHSHVGQARGIQRERSLGIRADARQRIVGDHQARHVCDEARCGVEYEKRIFFWQEQGLRLRKGSQREHVVLCDAKVRGCRGSSAREDRLDVSSRPDDPRLSLTRMPLYGIDKLLTAEQVCDAAPNLLYSTVHVQGSRLAEPSCLGCQCDWPNLTLLPCIFLAPFVRRFVRISKVERRSRKSSISRSSRLCSRPRRFIGSTSIRERCRSQRCSPSKPEVAPKPAHTAGKTFSHRLFCVRAYAVRDINRPYPFQRCLSCAQPKQQLEQRHEAKGREANGFG
jgi:hypothetical protein